MVAPVIGCDRSRLQMLLDETCVAACGPGADAQLQRETLAHLETCAFCRRQLEALAAEPSWWRGATTFLKNDPQESEIEATVPPTKDENKKAGGHKSHTYYLLQPSDDPAALGRLGDYDVLAVLGYGGMGVVFKAFDAELNRFVAIKALAPHFAHHGAARRRFAREAQAAAAVTHANVVAIYSVDAADQSPFLVMQYVAGPTLQQRLDQEGPLELRDVLRIAIQAAKGLDAAHAQGLVHRDIKPANILLEKGGQRVLLTDFGLARAADDATLTASGILAGTPQYMSPEQASGQAADVRSDLFSLGGVMYAMCTGSPPFRSQTTMGVLRKICDQPTAPTRHLNPDVPPWLEGIIDKLMDKDPDRRFASAAETAVVLEACLAHVQQPTRLPLPKDLPQPRPPKDVQPSASAKQSGGRRGRRRAWWILAALVVVLAACLALVITFWPLTSSSQSPASGPAPEKPLDADLEWNIGTDEELQAIEKQIHYWEQFKSSFSSGETP